VAAGYTVLHCPQATNDHAKTATGRRYYGRHAEAARLYVVFKWLWFTEARRLRALAFLVAASLHAVASATRQDGPGGLSAGLRTVGTALRHIRSFARERT
jgi:hypothetical protein